MADGVARNALYTKLGSLSHRRTSNWYASLTLGAKILTAIAPSFGCQNIVNFQGVDKLSNLNALNQIIGFLP
jgi:hypothetical protein